MYQLRPARPEDFAFALRLHHEALRPYVEKLWGWNESEQNEHTRRWFVPDQLQIVQSEGRDSGLLQMERRPDCIFLGNIWICAFARGKGLGEAVMRDILTSSGMLPVRLQVLLPNVGARRFYERLGFRVAGTGEFHVRMEWVPNAVGSKNEE